MTADSLNGSTFYVIQHIFQAVLRYALVCFKNFCLLCELRTLKIFKQETET